MYIQFNSKLLSKREKIKSKKIIDVLVSSDTCEAQGFLQEGGDDCALVEFRDGRKMRWKVQGYLGLSLERQWEQMNRLRRRSARVRELYEGEEFECEEEEYEDENRDYSEEEI